MFFRTVHLATRRDRGRKERIAAISGRGSGRVGAASKAKTSPVGRSKGLDRLGRSHIVGSGVPAPGTGPIGPRSLGFLLRLGFRACNRGSKGWARLPEMGRGREKVLGGRMGNRVFRVDGRA